MWFYSCFLLNYFLNLNILICYICKIAFNHIDIMNNYDEFYDELMDLIYKIPLDSNGWQPFVKRINAILGSSSIHILAIDLERDVYSFSNCSGMLSEEELTVSELQYLRHPLNEDPRLKGFFAPGRKGWYQCHHTITDEMVENSALYQDILLPIDMRFTAIKEFLLDDKLCVLMGINTSKKRGILTETELSFLDRLFVHLKRVVLLQRNLYEYSSKSLIGFELIDKLSQPIILLNLSGVVIHTNHAAKNILEKNKILKIENSNIFLPEPYYTQFKESLSYLELLFKKERLLKNTNLDDGCIKISEKEGSSLYIFSTLLISEAEMKMFGIRPTVMLTLYDPNHPSEIDLHLLHVSFNLTQAEAKVALLLLDGFLPKKIAQKHGVNLDTVRKQLQAIYKKTSTNRQSELVKLLLNIPRFLQEQ